MLLEAKSWHQEISQIFNNMKYYIITLILFFFLIVSCEGEKKKPAFYDSGEDLGMEYSEQIENESNDYNEMTDSEIISVPFKERNGVKYVNVSVNGFGFEMIFDTGCSGTLISVAEANYLYQKGFLSQDDILGVTQSQIADGSIVENMVINLREVIIDEKISCPNVIATVSANNDAPLLLGNEILNRVAAYAIDNQSKTINFKLK